MNYVFVSMLVPDDMASEIYSISKRNMQDAANALQWHIYHGLCQNLNTNISLINTLPVGSFPQYCTQAFLRRSTFNTQYGGENVNIGFLNIKLIRKKSQSRKIYRELKRWAAKTQGDKTIFVYTASAIFLKAAAKVKKKYPQIQICDIIADLPGMTSLSSKKSLLQKAAAKRMEQASDIWLNHVDYFVLLTKQMAQYLKIQKPFCVMEGIATKCDAPEKELRAAENETKTVFYSGTLHKKFGVLTLLQAFRQIPQENYCLQLCGVGDSEAEIIRAAAEDKRIEFLGRLPREQVLELQKKATVLVNPRPNNGEFTKYSFPSKNLEYLSSGTPMIGYKLDGIPDDYDRYMFYVDNDTAEALSQKIVEVCEMPQLQRYACGYEAWKYVSENKNEIMQTKRIIEMLPL